MNRSYSHDSDAGRELVIDTADRLRLARIKAGIEQEEMAEVLGVSSSTISNWEHGRTAPKDAIIVAWARVTGFRHADLLGGADAARRAQRLLASRTRRHHRRDGRDGQDLAHRVSWLPRMDSNHQPPDSPGPQQSRCIRLLNVTELLEQIKVCPGGEHKISGRLWYDTPDLSWASTTLSNRIKPTNVAGFFGGESCSDW